jgi:hypothetical protein
VHRRRTTAATPCSTIRYGTSRHVRSAGLLAWTQPSESFHRCGQYPIQRSTTRHLIVVKAVTFECQVEDALTTSISDRISDCACRSYKMSTLWSNWEFLPALLSFASAPHAHQQAILDWLVAYLVTSSRRSRIAEAVKGVPTGFRPTRSPVIRSLLTVIFTPEGDRALSSEGREKPCYEAAGKSSAAANSSILSSSQWQAVDVHDLRSRNPAGVLQSWRRALPS